MESWRNAPAKSAANGAVTVFARVRAFLGQGIREHYLTVDESGTVRVYSVVTGHYTTCHALSARAQARIRRIAAEM